MKREVPYILMLIMIVLRFGFEWIGPLDAWVLADGMKVRSLISWAMTWMGFGAFGLGIVNFTRVHYGNIRHRREHWMFSAYTIVLAWTYGVYGVIKGNNDPLFSTIFKVVSEPLDATMFSLLAFFIASAAYRAFRVKNLESTIMMAVAFVVMLANVPFGEMIWSSQSWLGGFSGIRTWILATPTAAVSRAISIGAFLGGVANTWRVVLGIERRHLAH